MDTVEFSLILPKIGNQIPLGDRKLYWVESRNVLFLSRVEFESPPDLRNDSRVDLLVSYLAVMLRERFIGMVTPISGPRSIDSVRVVVNPVERSIRSVVRRAYAV
jgi:hypothetical protein